MWFHLSLIYIGRIKHENCTFMGNYCQIYQGFGGLRWKDVSRVEKKLDEGPSQWLSVQENVMQYRRALLVSRADY